MDVREKLVELMKEVKYSVFPDSTDKYTFGIQHNDHIFKQVAGHLIASGVTVQEWISVKDRLPEEYTYVLVCDVRVDYVAEWEYRRNGIWDHEGCSYDNGDLTHWMPLPQPPKGE